MMLPTVISTVFADLPDLATKVQKQIDSTKKPLSIASLAILRAGCLSLPEVRRLLFVQTVYELSPGDEPFRNVLLTRYASKVGSPDQVRENQLDVFSQIALDLYHDESLPVSAPETLNTFRTALWRRRPLAVLLATLRTGKLLETQNLELRPHVEKALETAISKNLAIVSTEFRSIINDPIFFQVNDEEGGEDEYEEDEDDEDGGKDAEKGSKEVVDAGKVYDLLLSLQRLHFLVSDPSHVDVLLRLNLRSAHDVAVLPRGTFLSLISEETGRAKSELKLNPDATVVLVDESAAIRLHDHATAIDCRNQETWIKVLDGLKDDFVAIDGQLPKKSVKKERAAQDGGTAAPSNEDLLAHRNYNMTEIFDLQSTPCEECCSVISASAYLVDLLKFLETCVCETAPAEPASTSSGNNAASAVIKATSQVKKVPKNLLEALSARRPDLQELELSCANSNVMLPYVAIVNEVLESFITSVGGTKPEVAAVAITNCKQDPSSHKSGYQPSRTGISSVFTNDIATAMFPLDVFPYSQSLHAIKTYLSALGLSRGDVLSTFRSEARIVAAVQGGSVSLPENDLTAEKTLLSEAKFVWERAAAAETLGLQPLDVAAITRETVYTKELLVLALGLRPKQTAGRAQAMLDGLKVSDIWTYWGYSSLEAMVDTDEDLAAGLGFVRAQFLPRSGLSFEELLELLNSLFFGRRLVLTNARRVKEFTGQISEMRLQALNMSAVEPKQHAIGPLTAQLCHELQAFIRLKVRLGWTVADLDAALSAIIENHSATGTDKSASEGFSTLILSDLARIVTLSDLVDMPVDKLLPLWTQTISTHGGSKSLYARVFQGPGLVLAGDDVFVPSPVSGSVEGKRYFERQPPIGEHIPALMTTLRRNQHELQSLLQAAGGQNKVNDPLTMTLLSRLYRHNTMCTILRASPAEYLQLLALLPHGMDLFQDPRVTLEFVQQWRQLQDKDWSTADMLAALASKTSDISTATNTQVVGEALGLASGLVDKLDNMQALWNPRVQQKVVREQDVSEVCGQLYEGTTAREVSTFIEGLQITQATAPSSSAEGKALVGLTALPSNIEVSVTPQDNGGIVTLTLTGVLSSEAKTSLLKNKAAAPKLEALVEKLDVQSRTSYSVLSTRLFDHLSPEEKEKAERLFTNDVRDGIKGTDEADDVILLDEARRDRRATFIKAALPALRGYFILDAIVHTIETSVGGGLEAPVLSVLATTALLSPPEGSEEKQSALEALEKLLVAPQGDKPIKNAFFSPIATDSYRFMLLPEASEAPSFCINGIDLPLIEAADGSHWKSAPVMMTTGQLYAVSCSVPLNSSRAFWSTKQSSPTAFSSKVLVPQATVNDVASILDTVTRAARLVKKLGLGLEELKYVTTSPSALVRLDLDSPSLASLCALESYRALRDSCSVKTETSRDVLIGLLAWLGNPTGEQTVSDLGSRIAAVTGWDEPQVVTAINLKYPGLSAASIIARFRDIEELASMQAVLDVSQRISLTPAQRQRDSAPQPLLVLFQVATPSPPERSSNSNAQTGTTRNKDADTAAGLQACLGEGLTLAQCTRDMREAQRTALVAYLLQQPYVRKLGISDADGLFAHFLLDVQMGAQLEITLIKAAISTIQLYVQRCLLGLEPEAATARIDQAKWSWMGRHNIWQATRKAYLYPENWIEPSLRDDKTPQFDALESTLMSKDLSWKSFSKGIREYVQALQPIADLDIVAYLREDTPLKASVEVYHFFGRTRSAPYTFYHRVMRITRPGRGRVIWSPWTKVDADIMAYEADWDGTSLTSSSGSYLLPLVRSNRLFLYLPQIMTRPLSASEKAQNSASEPADFYGLAKTRPASGPGPCNWEIRMAWTELVDGVWAPKRVSQAQLSVDWQKPDEKDLSGWRGLPSIAHFVFATETKASDVTIRVAYQRPAFTTSTEKVDPPGLYPVGNFEIGEDRVIAIKNKAQGTKLGTAISTSFHKLWWSAQPDPENATDDRIATPAGSMYSYSVSKDARPLLGLPKRGYSRSLTWTLSFSSSTAGLSHATGLVVDEQEEGATLSSGRSILMYPRESTTLDSAIDSSNLWKSASTEVIEHSNARSLMEAVCQRDDLASVETLYTKLSSDLTNNSDWGKAVVEKGMSNFHELASAYALYNWELGLHAVLLAVDRFYSTQQFDLALRAARLVFDPMAIPPPSATTAAKKAAACWQFPPFRQLAEDKSIMADMFQGWPDDSVLEIAVTERRSNPWTAHGTARGRPQAYMKWIVMKYVEILVAAGDVSFRQGTMETLPLAIQRYVEAAHVLGPDPPTVPRLGKPVNRNFKTIGAPEASVPLELVFPFICEVERRGSERVDKTDQRQRSELLCLLSTTYFSLPPNPKYASLRSLVVDRLFKARNNLDISGRPIIYAMTDPAIDPASVMAALSGGAGGSGGGIASLVNDIDCPMPYQRFSVLLAKALELCAEVRAMGEQFLAAREKQDAEALALLKARQDATRQRMLLDIKALQRDEIKKTIESLEQNRDSSVAHLRYLLRLTGDSLERVPDKESKGWEDIDQAISTPTSDDLRMSPYEKGEIISAGVASGLKTVAAGMETVVGVLRAIPEVTTNAQPMGCGVTVKADATNAARITKGIMGSLKVGSMIATDVSTAFARVGSLTRQLQERRMQANAKGREIKHIDKQIEIQRVRLNLNTHELELQRYDVANATETETWLRSKYTNDRLYAWLEGQLRTLHFDMYSLAADMCRRAERAFRFERSSRTVVPLLRAGGYWDSSRDGLLAAQQLSIDLRRMEAAFLQTPAHDFELSKNISLRQLDPQALLTLREKGTTTFSLPEMLFDIDFPGHYMRRLQSVAVSVPCILGPHATLPATLSLTQHSYRVSAAPSTSDDYLAASISDGSFRTDVVPIAAVATSSGIQDTGTFDLSFGSGPSDGRYGPFEGAGAVSSWRLELPSTTVQPFNYNTISDVVLHLRYTAVDGGPLLKRAASAAVSALRTRAEGLGARDGFWGFLEARHELATEWITFRSVLSQVNVTRTASLDLSILANMLPFWVNKSEVLIESLTVAITTSDTEISNDLGIEALGTTKDVKGQVQQKWQKTSLGNVTLLTREKLTQGNISLNSPGLVLTVDKAAGKACEIKDLAVYFRYVF